MTISSGSFQSSPHGGSTITHDGLTARDDRADSATFSSAPLIPHTMRAWVIREDRHGPPSRALRLEETSVPLPGPGEVLVKVMAAGVNYNAVWLCRGEPVPLSRLRTGYDYHIPGSDASGVVCQVGDGVRRWQPGDEVVLHCNVSCRQCPACDGLDSLACEDQRIWGYETNWGSFAPYTKVQAQQLLPKPRGLTWEAASSYGLCLFTAYRMLVTRARLQAGENVLVWGAAGGLGGFAIQLSLLCGATPVCVVSSDAKADFCREVGARYIFNRRQYDLDTVAGIRELGRDVRAVLRGRDPDVVFEHVGRATFQASMLLCAKFGRIVLCGATSGPDVAFDARYLWMRQKSILGSHFANYYEADRANSLVAERKIRPLLSETVPFDELPRAVAQQEDPDHFGKLAILVGAETPGLGLRPD